MSKTPPIPAENQSPFPIEEPPHDHSGDNEAVAAVRQMAASKQRWSPSSGEIRGAAVGVGSAAIVAALLYWRGNRKPGK